MPFGFFDWLRVHTRDAILDGASEAGRALEQGTKGLAERTEAVTTFEDVTGMPSEPARPGIGEQGKDRRVALSGTVTPKREGVGRVGPDRPAETGRPAGTKHQDRLDARSGTNP